MKQNIPSLFFFKRLIILLFILSFFFYNQPLFAQSINNLNASELSSIPKYENLKMWAAHPWKKDFSDSVPKGIINEIKDFEGEIIAIDTPNALIDELVATGFEKVKEVKKANLEDVFIHRTGKAWRED